MSARRESSIARMKLVNSRADFATESIEAANAVECLFRTLVNVSWRLVDVYLLYLFVATLSEETCQTHF